MEQRLSAALVVLIAIVLHGTGSAEAAGDARKRAFVMLAFEAPGDVDVLWNVIPIAHVIKNMSKYPLVVLTNTTHWPDTTSVAESLGKLGVEVRSVRDVPVPDKLLTAKFHGATCWTAKMGSKKFRKLCNNQYLKLQIWNLLEYEKLVYLDADAILTRNVDHLFELPGTWAAVDNWFCGCGGKIEDEWKNKAGNTGMVVLEPARKAYRGLIKTMRRLTEARYSDQTVIQRFFGKSLKRLQKSIANFGHCVTEDLRTLPAFLHKSDEENSCFRPAAAPHLCRHSAGAKHWRHHFCAGAAAAGVRGAEVEGLCSQQAGVAWDAAKAASGSSVAAMLAARAMNAKRCSLR